MFVKVDSNLKTTLIIYVKFNGVFNIYTKIKLDKKNVKVLIIS